MSNLTPTAPMSLTPTIEPLTVHMVTIKELSEKTGVSEHHIRNLCKTNQIKFIRTGVKYLVNFERFIDYLNGN